MIDNTLTLIFDSDEEEPVNTSIQPAIKDAEDEYFFNEESSKIERGSSVIR